MSRAGKGRTFARSKSGGKQDKPRQKAMHDGFAGPEAPSPSPLAASLDANLDRLRELLGHSVDLVEKPFRMAGGRGPRCAVLYYQGLADRDLVHSRVIEPVLLWSRRPLYPDAGKLDLTEISEQHLVANVKQVAKDIRTVMNGLFDAHAVLLVDGFDQALVIRAQGYKIRNVSEPVVEPVVRGPREGFIEDIVTNVALLRRRLRSPHLVIEKLTVGDESREDVHLAYAAHIAPPALIDEVRRRLNALSVESSYSIGLIEEQIRDHPWALWPTTIRTERPDTAASAILQGRAVILVDGDPGAVVIPGTFWGQLQAQDDYYLNYYVAGLVRLLRLVALGFAVFGTSVYVAITTFHHEMIPLPLMLNIAAIQKGIPLPVAWIAFGMEFLIEIVREAGLRLPRPFGSAVTIVGTIVLGEAAFAAGLVPPVLAIVVAAGTIASFAIPRYETSVSFRVLRFPALIAGATLGLFGVAVVAAWAVFDLCAISSLGVPYLALYSPGRVRELLDKFVVPPPRIGVPKRPLGYRDKTRAGKPPDVAGRIPWLERKGRRRR